MQSSTSKKKWQDFSLIKYYLQQLENSSPSYSLILNHEEFVHVLLQNGAFFNDKDQDKRTPIEDGLMKKRMTTFKTMIAYTQF